MKFAIYKCSYLDDQTFMYAVDTQQEAEEEIAKLAIEETKKKNIFSIKPVHFTFMPVGESK